MVGRYVVEQARGSYVILPSFPPLVIFVRGNHTQLSPCSVTAR
jgi:hypothetical protein